MPPIESKAKSTPKDFFLYLASIVTLYVSIGSFLALFFSIIDRIYPDALQYYVDPYSGAIRFAIAALIIIFPLHLFIMWYINKDLRSNPEKRELGIRKWLIYLTVFLASAIIIGDLVVLINTFLGGEITARFVWKVIGVLAVFGATLGYYAIDLRKSEGISQAGGRTFGGVALVVVLATIIGGFLVMGSPMKIRQIKLDQRRVSDLQGIQYQALNYWQQKRVLPNAITELNNPLQNYSVPVDPETGASYEYRATSDLSFELCANFGTKSVNNQNDRSMTKVLEDTPFKGLDNWEHDAGKKCFERTIDPVLYPQVIREGQVTKPILVD